MNLTRKVSTTTYPIVFMMVDATDHITGETGLTPTVTISKNGASFGAVSGSVTELGGGLYSLAGNATDRNTLGELWIHAEAAGADNVDLKVDIVSHDPYGDIAEILTDTGTTIPGLLDAIKGAGWTDETLMALMTAVESGTVDEATIRSAIGLATANLDTQLSTIDTEVGTIYSEMASVDDITTPLSVVDDIVDAIKTKTDQLTFTTLNKVDASATIDPTGLATSADLAVVDANVDEIKAKTDQLAFSVPNRVDASATVDPTGIATSEELEVIGEKVDNVLDKLNVSSVEFVTSVVGSTITILRGDTLTASLLNLGSMESYVSLDFTVKRNTSNTDDEAVIRIRKNASGLTDGLLRLNGAAHTTGTDGSITINDAPTGDITIMLKAGVTDDLVPGTYVYDIQLITATAVKTLTSGRLNVTSDVTRAIA